MTQPFTLLGAIADVIRKQNSDDNSLSPEMESAIKSCIENTVTKTFIDSLSAEVDDPVLLTFSNFPFFFANGTPITIKERTDGIAGALITWDGGEMAVANNCNVFAGRHDDDTPTNGSIVMEGGTVRNIIGGGMHKSHTVTTKVVINGGSVYGIQGGGASSLEKNCGCENTFYSGDAKKSPCVTDDITVIVNGGESVVCYGGGEGISYSKKVNITFGGTAKTQWLTAGGSNGRTDEAKMVIADNAEVIVVQGVNRGSMNKIAIDMTGGNVTALYAGGEVPLDSSQKIDATGIFTESTLVVNGGNIGTLHTGAYNGIAIKTDDEITKNISITVNDSANIENCVLV